MSCPARKSTGLKLLILYYLFYATYFLYYLFSRVFSNMPSVFKPKLLFFLDVYLLGSLKFSKAFIYWFIYLFSINHDNIIKPQIIAQGA